MKAIDILVMEHENVLEFTDAVKNKCKKIFNGESLNIEYFKKVLDFGRNYVDSHHHKKEEDILFKVMIDKLGEPISHVIKDGMLFDHNVGRMFLMNLDYAISDYKMEQSDDNKLKIISNAYSYADMMENHIDKENEVLYPFAENNLSLDDQEDVNIKVNNYEENARKNGIKEKYIELLNELKN